jgi:hypothetical protein
MTQDRLPSRSTPNGNPLVPVWEWLDGQAPAWWTGHIAFRGPKRTVVVDGTRWTVYFNIHGNRPSRGSSKVQLSAMLSVLPEGVTKAQTHRLMRSGWFRAFKRHVASYGYLGGWRDARWGRSAVFVKDLADLGELKAEVARVRKYRLRVSEPRGEAAQR